MTKIFKNNVSAHKSKLNLKQSLKDSVKKLSLTQKILFTLYLISFLLILIGIIVKHSQ